MAKKQDNVDFTVTITFYRKSAGRKPFVETTGRTEGLTVRTIESIPMLLLRYFHAWKVDKRNAERRAEHARLEG